jgi:hypothetical protein
VLFDKLWAAEEHCDRVNGRANELKAEVERLRAALEAAPDFLAPDKGDPYWQWMKHRDWYDGPRADALKG